MSYSEFFNTQTVEIEDKNGNIKQKIIYEPKYKDNSKKKIYSPIRNKYLNAQPEEVVRQEFICKLINDYGYKLEQMDEEVELTTSQRGTGRASADIVVWKSEEEKKNKKTAFLVVELKADTLRLKVEDCYQGYNYATWSRAKLFAISSGHELQVYKTIEEELPLSLQPVNDIPYAKDILDDKKLSDALAQTKEFTGSEFATLLHKCHNIIRNNDKLSPEASFDEINKILFIKIMYERKPKQEAIFSFKQFNMLKREYIEKFKKEKENQITLEEKQRDKYIKSGDFDEAEKINKHIEELRKEVPQSYIQELFKEVKNNFKQDNIFEENEKIKLREKSFEQIVKELEIYNLTSTSADIKGIAFEKFLGKTFRGELGQFFTPRVIVDFIVHLLDLKENEFICDPCAGSGGFLIKTFEKIKEEIDEAFIKRKREKFEELFGDFKRLSEEEESKLQGDELKKYEAEKDEYLKKINDEKLNEEYEAFLSKVNKEQGVKIEKLSHKSIYGTDANPRMAKVSKMNMIMHGDGHNGIHHNDGLLNVNGIFRNRFDVILTNPPFGTNLDKKFPVVEEEDRYTNKEMIKKYIKEYGDVYVEEMKQVTDHIDEPIRGLFEVGKTSGATEVLFIERCLDLLKPGGRMGIVLPEGVLNSSNLQSAREYFESRAKILLIVSLPQDIFISSGATVKTSLVFFRKFTEEEAQEYERIRQSVTEEIEAKYSEEIEPIEAKLKLRGKEAPSKEEKKELRAQLKALKEKISQKIKQQVKEQFDYEIPISDIKKAGIATTREEGENQLPELLELFTAYRKEKQLWEEKVS